MNSKLIIAFVMMALVVVVVAIPILSGVHFYEQELNEDADYRYSEYRQETLEFVYTGETLTMNGESFASFTAGILITDTIYVNATNVVDFTTSSVIPWASGDTLTVVRGTVSGTGSMASLSLNLGSNAIFVDNDGELGSYHNTGVYVNQNTKVYAYYTNNPCMLAAGEVSDGLTVLRSGSYSTSITPVEITSITMNTTETPDGAILLNSVDFTASGSDTSKSAFFVVPLEYQVQSGGGTTGQIVDVIPVMLVISLLVIIATAFIRRV